MNSNRELVHGNIENVNFLDDNETKKMIKKAKKFGKAKLLKIAKKKLSSKQILADK